MTIEAEHPSTCPICGEPIEEGDLIAKDMDGSWSHEECVEQQREEM